MDGSTRWFWRCSVNVSLCVQGWIFNEAAWTWRTTKNQSCHFKPSKELKFNWKLWFPSDWWPSATDSFGLACTAASYWKHLDSLANISISSWGMCRQPRLVVWHPATWGATYRMRFYLGKKNNLMLIFDCKLLLVLTVLLVLFFSLTAFCKQRTRRLKWDLYTAACKIKCASRGIWHQGQKGQVSVCFF